jgi:hypothetical protein
MELGPMGPIGEGRSLLVRVNRNCPWNKCLFCPVYKGSTFSVRSVEEIMADIDAVSRTCELLDAASWHIGLGGRFSPELAREVIRTYPEIYGKYPHDCTHDQISAVACLKNVANWLYHGANRVFLQDADAVALHPDKLSRVLRYLKERFPTVETVSSYARSKTCHRRTAEDIAMLKENGLTMCLMGIETGSEKLLSYMRKGVRASEHIDAGQKLVACGITLAAFIMPGLGGCQGQFPDHLSGTVEILNAIRPHEVRVRSLAVIEGSPLYLEWLKGEFKTPTEEQIIDEIRFIINNFDFDCELETLQMTNTLFAFRGRLGLHRDALLGRIDRFKALPAHEKAGILLDRCVEGGYLDFINSMGRCDKAVEQAIDQARKSIDQAFPDALERTDAALFVIKSKGIP